MELGTSTVDITPPVGLDLSGYLACTQPSIGVHDPLFVRGLYVKGDAGKLLWLHADLIGFHREFVLELKGRIGSELGIGADKIVVSAEPFSVLADEVREKTDRSVYIVGYANGALGYLAPKAAYGEGGHEIESAFVYYNGLPVRRGEFERLRDRAVELMRSME